MSADPVPHPVLRLAQTDASSRRAARSPRSTLRAVPPVAARSQRSISRYARSRDGRPETIYRVVNTVRGGRRLIDGGLRGAVLDRFRQVLARHPVELFGLSVRADGYVLLIRALDDRLPVVMRDLQSGLARAVNRAQGTRGRLWAGKVRYQPARSHPDAMEQLVELLLEADRVADDGGLSSAALLMSEAPLPTEGAALPLHTLLPWFGTLDDRAVARRLARAVSTRRVAARRWRLG